MPSGHLQDCMVLHAWLAAGAGTRYSRKHQHCPCAAPGSGTAMLTGKSIGRSVARPVPETPTHHTPSPALPGGSAVRGCRHAGGLGMVQRRAVRPAGCSLHPRTPDPAPSPARRKCPGHPAGPSSGSRGAQGVPLGRHFYQIQRYRSVARGESLAIARCETADLYLCQRSRQQRARQVESDHRHYVICDAGDGFVGSLCAKSMKYTSPCYGSSCRLESPLQPFDSPLHS